MLTTIGAKPTQYRAQNSLQESKAVRAWYWACAKTLARHNGVAFVPTKKATVMIDFSGKTSLRHFFAILVSLIAVNWHQDAFSDNKRSIVGTAFFIRNDGILLTNRHVVDGCKRIFVIPEDDNPYPASIVAVSKKYDLAALQSLGYTPKTFVAMRAAQDKRYVSIPEDGEEVVTGGFSDPLNMDFSISIVDGVTLRIEGYSERGSIDTIMLSSVRRGASGSAVIDYSGNLVGIIHSGVEDLPIKLPRTLEKFDSLVYFHNNNAIADFLTEEGIQFHFQKGGGKRLMRIELFGHAFNATALINCQR